MRPIIAAMEQWGNGYQETYKDNQAAALAEEIPAD
jgi:hypothetical protein